MVHFNLDFHLIDEISKVFVHIQDQLNLVMHFEVGPDPVDSFTDILNSDTTVSPPLFLHDFSKPTFYSWEEFTNTINNNYITLGDLDNPELLATKMAKLKNLAKGDTGPKQPYPWDIILGKKFVESFAAIKKVSDPFFSVPDYVDPRKIISSRYRNHYELPSPQQFVEDIKNISRDTAGDLRTVTNFILQKLLHLQVEIPDFKWLHKAAYKDTLVSINKDGTSLAVKTDILHKSDTIPEMLKAIDHEKIKSILDEHGKIKELKTGSLSFCFPQSYKYLKGPQDFYLYTTKEMFSMCRDQVFRVTNYITYFYWRIRYKTWGLREVDDLIIIIVTFRFFYLAIRLNILTAFKIMVICCVAAYLWYRKFVYSIFTFDVILNKFALTYKFSQDAMYVKDLFTFKKKHAYTIYILDNPARFLKELIFKCSYYKGYRIDPISLLTSLVIKRLEGGELAEAVEMYYYYFMTFTVPDLISLSKELYMRFSGIVAYTYVVRLNKKHMPYFIKWHWTCILLVSSCSTYITNLFSRLWSYLFHIIYPTIWQMEADNVPAQWAIYEKEFLVYIALYIAIFNTSFYLYGMLSALFGQYLAFPIISENTETHIGRRAENEKYGLALEQSKLFQNYQNSNLNSFLNYLGDCYNELIRDRQFYSNFLYLSLALIVISLFGPLLGKFASIPVFICLFLFAGATLVLFMQIYSSVNNQYYEKENYGLEKWFNEENDNDDDDDWENTDEDDDDDWENTDEDDDDDWENTDEDDDNDWENTDEDDDNDWENTDEDDDDDWENTEWQ